MSSRYVFSFRFLRCADCLAVVLQHLIGLAGYVYSGAVTIANENDTERAALQHTRKVPFSLANS